MKKKIFRITVCIMCISLLFGSGMIIHKKNKDAEVSMKSLSDDLLIPGGMPVGIYMETEGVMVLGTEAIKAYDGKKYEPADRLVKKGDYIIEINHEKIKNKKQFMEKVKKIKDKEILLKLRRGDQILNVKVEPVRNKKGVFQLGIWIRDNTQGLGTLTFIDKNSNYGALGHGIHDIDTGELLDLSNGRLYRTSIKDIKKGKSGKPGGIEGIIVYNPFNVIGTIVRNTNSGIYGHLNKPIFDIMNQKPVKIASKNEVKKGNAIVRCCVDGRIRDYKIRIHKINIVSREINKGFEIEVIDPELIRKTGGIVQGMSGSPVIQNGRIVGAVTHVLVNDPTRGYGIFIENMLKATE